MKRKIEILSELEFQDILKCCNPRYPTGKRNRALLLALYQGCLRCAEAVALEEQDLEDDRLTIHRGKGHKRRVIPLPPAVAAAIDAWLQTKAQKGIKGPLFSTLTGKPMSTSYVRNLFVRLNRRSKLKKRLHAHGLRHSGASWLSRIGVSVADISSYLGHGSIAMTERYLHSLSPDDMIKRVEKFWDTTPST